MIVCGKCGAKAVHANEPSPFEGGITERSFSCIKCGNTSESVKYGFREENMGTVFAEEGICTNCKRTRTIIKTMGLCYTCQRAAKGVRGKEREELLEEVKEKISKGEIATRAKPKKKLEFADKNSIVLNFVSEEDIRLKKKIEKSAIENRRTADQQVLWICQNALFEKKEE